METTSHIWAYGIGMEGGEPSLLMGERSQHPAFRHLACGMPIHNPHALPSDLEFFKAAQNALATEAKLGLDLTKFSMLYYDPTSDSSWIDGVGCAHVLADFGRHRILPAPQPAVIELERGSRGLVTAGWIKLSRLEIFATPQMVAPGASPHIFFGGMPLRSTIANALGPYIVPALQERYGALRPLPDFNRFIVRQGPSPVP